MLRPLLHPNTASAVDLGVPVYDLNCLRASRFFAPKPKGGCERWERWLHRCQAWVHTLLNWRAGLRMHHHHTCITLCEGPPTQGKARHCCCQNNSLRTAVLNHRRSLQAASLAWGSNREPDLSKAVDNEEAGAVRSDQAAPRRAAAPTTTTTTAAFCGRLPLATASTPVAPAFPFTSS